MRQTRQRISKDIRAFGLAAVATASILAMSPFSASLADDTSSAFYEKGVQLMKRKEFKKAIEAFDMSIGMAATDARDYMRRGQCFFELGHWSLAIKDFGEAMNYAEPNDPSPYLCQGIAYVKLGEHVKAVRDFEKAIKIDPNLGDAYAGMGQAYEAQGEKEAANTSYQQALKGYNATLKKDPKDVKALVGRADILHVLGKNLDALKDYSYAIELEPEYDVAYIHRGSAYSGMDRPEDALKDYDKALEMDPSNGDLLKKRGRAYFVLKNAKQALEDFTAAIKQDNTNPDLYYHRAKAYMQLGDDGQAMANLEDAIRINPNQANFYLARAFLWHKEGKSILAREDIKRAQFFDPSLPKDIRFATDPKNPDRWYEETFLTDKNKTGDKDTSEKLENFTSLGGD
ncbi:MAG: tetratricopeptide repeat protein [Candidatus Obscuribacterales bacterium]